VKYIDATPLVEGGDIIQSLRDRILGRVAAEDIRDPLSNEIIVQANTEITEELAQKIEDSGLERVRIRSTLTCDTKRGICVMCYGRNLGTGRLAELGEAVGIIAAQSIGEPGTQLTMRTFHIGGTASRVVEASKHEAKSAGIVKYHNLRTVVNRDGDLVATNRNGEIGVADERGRERERYPVVYGAKIKVKADQRIKTRAVLVEWDPFTNPILTEFTGRVEYQDIIEGVTVREEFDEVTGLARKVVIEDPEGKLQPGVIRLRGRGAGDGRADRASPVCTAGRRELNVPDGAEVFAADIAKIPRETTKTKDITGGLPRVAELFEARKPKEQAVITEIDGRVEMGGFVKGMRKIVIRDNAETKEYLILRGKHISVHEGDRVRAGEALMDGSPNPHDYLAVLGDREPSGTWSTRCRRSIACRA
jgi:DNA-directed RNA polymerase subunit beta'